MNERTLARIILHLDMDAFYAAVEIRENPSLAGKPLIIGHRGRRGVVSTCSYEARRFGVRSAMPSVQAEKLCPDALWLPGRMEVYVRESRAIRGILAETAPVVEPLSIDEAFLDMTGAVRDLEEGRRVARDLKERIRGSLCLTASIGVAPNKFLAKVASDMEKPDGLVVLSQADVPVKLWPMPIRTLWGVGPRMAGRLEALSVRTVGDLLEVPVERLTRTLGASAARHLRALARGDDDRPVHGGHEAKSISEERTYGEDLREPDEIDRALLARSEGVARELRRKHLSGRTIHLKVRAGDFTTWTRSKKLAEPTDLAEVVVRAARELYRDRIRLRGRGVRLLGVGVSGLGPARSGQPPLFEDPDEQRARRMTRAADAVRERLGEDAVTRARLLRRPKESSSLPSVD